jgi:hypothetical protein
MPMNIPQLSGEIKTAIQEEYGPADDSATLDKFCNAIAKAVINHIKINGTITFLDGDIPVQVSIASGTGANIGGGGTGKIS